MISVVMPVYNSEDYLAEAIESILNQTYTDFEFIIINDGSTDGCLAIIERYQKQDKRIVCISKENGGVASALNAGLIRAKGDYIVRMDSDDVSYPKRLEALIEYMECNKNVDICGSWALKNGKGKMQVPIDDIEIKLQMIFFCAFIHPTVIIRKAYMDQMGFFYNLVCAEDYDLWIRCSATATFANVPQYLLMYREHKNNISGLGNQDKFMKDDLRVKNLYCQIQGADIVFEEHFLSDDFSDTELQKYEKFIKYMVDKYKSNHLPVDMKKRLIIIYIERYKKVIKVVRRYINFLETMDFKMNVKEMIYIVLRCLKDKVERVR